ncbi:ABC transporter ATP-binding protein [Pseudogracilibacillus auburnensis]|uniref:ABC transporter ATP-binding protein n=1 Tax=Pseudogracilibacillus auburnensis TaxID=1494959 RepID=UPI001A95958E|nr:oligopeptide/dipeptide ABC transporter ATP-binding protein [Pseudogracilibacillus auburnensis]MBO1002510.1 ATP-binding cassette domain-containing protein [Pseudogracilibacillus auburnensis]
MSNIKEKVLEVKNLKKHFPVGRKTVLKAVDGINFHIFRGEIFGIVGESGCGKSTAGRTIIQLYEPTAGEIIFNGKKIQDQLKKKDLLKFRQDMQMIFQDPYASLNPRMNVREIITAGLTVHNIVPKNEHENYISELLEKVGLNTSHANRYPHEFSGGQRQRIGIARALSVNPKFIIADEPISALDVSIQAQVVNLMKELQVSRDLTFLFIAHDLSMVKHISDRIGVMYLGNMVEIATSEELYSNPLHPYTQALLSAIPLPNPKQERHRERIILKGDVPSPISPPSGCPFRTRCSKAMGICAEVKPEWKEIYNNHWVACHLYN